MLKGLWKTVQVKAVMPAAAFNGMARTPSQLLRGSLLLPVTTKRRLQCLCTFRDLPERWNRDHCGAQIKSSITKIMIPNVSENLVSTCLSPETSASFSFNPQTTP